MNRLFNFFSCLIVDEVHGERWWMILPLKNFWFLADPFLWHCELPVQGSATGRNTWSWGVQWSMISLPHCSTFYHSLTMFKFSCEVRENCLTQICCLDDSKWCIMACSESDDQWWCFSLFGFFSSIFEQNTKGSTKIKKHGGTLQSDFPMH